MKKIYFLLFFLPFYTQGQIFYPNGKTFDSSTFTFSNGDSLFQYISLPGFYLGDSSKITIDTSSTILWQIGNTHKPIFSNDTLSVRGIMTDTTRPYPKNANSYFILKIAYSVSNIIVDFWHKYETDSLHAGGIVEFSLDTGLTWMNITNCSSINTQNIYSRDDTLISGESAFTGTSKGEQLSRFQFINCWVLKTTNTDCMGVHNSYEYPIYFRFRFVSDSTTDSLSGWIIDSIRIEDPGCIPGYVSEVHKQYNLNISPNPTALELTIISTYKINRITITNLIGRTLYTHEYNSEKVQVDVADLPTGVYFIKINGTEVRKFVKE